MLTLRGMMLCTAVITAVACGKDENPEICGFVSTLSVSGRTVTITGGLGNDENEQPILVLKNTTTNEIQEIAAATYDHDQATFTVPPGTFSASFKMSGCTDSEGHEPGKIEDDRTQKLNFTIL